MPLDPGQARQLFEGIRLPTFDDHEARLVLLSSEQLENALAMAEEEFGRFVPRESVRSTLRYVDRRLSFGIAAGELLLGAYLICAQSLRVRGPYAFTLGDRPALQGEALVVHPLARGRGFGRILRQMLPEIGRLAGVDYVWGGALVELQNLSHWLRRRAHIHTGGGVHITVEPIAADLKQALLPLANDHLREQWIAELSLQPMDDVCTQISPTA